MSDPALRPRSRLAPSPTGALHLGNARTFLINWAMARQRNWTLVLRIDDLDGPRIKAGADREAIDILQWLGLHWDEGPYYPSQQSERYSSAWQKLAEQGRIYPCHCTRTQIQAASLSAPQSGQHELRYPGTCRPSRPQVIDCRQVDRAASAWRLRVPDADVAYADERLGKLATNVQSEVGDFLIFTKQSQPSYQLSVVCDDAAERITHVVRGDDLLTSTARQRLLYDALGIHEVPRYWHLPLIIGSDGRRLAKRHGDSRLTTYRSAGVRAERIIGLLAEWSGLGDRREMSAGEFAERFEIENLPSAPIIFTDADERWLTAARATDCE